MFVFLILALCAALFTGCQNSADEIVAYCVLDHTRMVLPIDFENATFYGETSFSTVYTLKGICYKVNKMSSGTAEYSAELYEDVVLIRMTTKEDSKLHFFAVLRNLINPNLNGFIFGCPTTHMGGGSFLIPYHLIDYHYDISDYEGTEEISEAEYTRIKENQRYLLRGTYEQFADFYRETGAFDVTETQNRILFTVKEEAYSSVEINGNTLNSKPESKRFTVDFIEKNGNTYIRYHAQP